MGPEDISFGDDFIVAKAGSDAVSGAGTATLVLQTERLPVDNVPEPGTTLGLLGIGLAALGLAMGPRGSGTLGRCCHEALGLRRRRHQ